MMIGKLTVATPSDTQIVVTRVLNAPKKMVFACLTTPKLLQRWMLGPPGWTMPVCTFEAKVGGMFRYVWRNAEGVDMGMSGTIVEFSPYDRIVHTEEFDADMSGRRTEVTSDFIENGGRTTLAMTIVYASKQDRDAALASGMTGGMEMGYERLDTLLAELD